MNSLSDMVNVACDLCGGDEHTLLFVKEDFRHVRCRGCGLVFVNPRLADHTKSQMSAGTGTMGDDRLTPSQERRFQREVASLERFRRLNRVLEVGAGRGWFLAAAVKAGWDAWAVEINSQALEHLTALNLARVITQPAEDFTCEPESVDVVRMWDVVEHLQSPRRALGNIHRALRPGGLLALATTNFASLSRWVNGPEWVYLNGSDHIVLFEPATITSLLGLVGFTAIRIRTRSFNLRRKLYHPERELPVCSRLLLPIRKLVDETIRLTPYGHQMIVTAHKRETG